MTILVDIIGEVVESVSNSLSIPVNYIYGRQSQILSSLQDKDGSITYKDSKYPALALYQDFPEHRGRGYYANILIPKIIIMNLTVATDYPQDRYTKVFKTILYPIYYEFLHQLSRHPNIIEADEDYIPHTKWDRIGTLPIGSDVHDYVDAIEINNLTITVSQIKLCNNGT